MKIMRLCCTVVGAATLLLSCYLTSTQTTGKIVFSVLSQSRGITPGSNLIRASLFSVKDVGGNWVGQSLYTFPGGLTYTQGSVGSTLTLSNIPVGTWAVLVTAGRSDSSGNFITTDYNYPYVVVSVVPGEDNPVTVTLQPSSVKATSLFGTNVPGVVNVSGTIYAVTSTQLYSVSGAIASAVGSPLPGGVSANSVGAGYYPGPPTGGPAVAIPYINTNAGIYYYTSSIQSDLAASNPIPMLESAAFSSGPDVALFYENQTGFGGAWLVTLSPFTWTNFNTGGAISGKPIYDFAVTQNSLPPSFVYFASKLGAFQANQSVVSSQIANIMNAAKFFTVPDGSTIISLCAAGSGSQPFYIGSTSGGWSATLNESSTPPVTGQTKISATSGDSIIKIAAGAGYVAFLSQYNLYLLNTSTSAVKVYPFYSGLPGQLSAMAWSATGPILYISGAASASTGAPGGLVTISGAGLP